MSEETSFSNKNSPENNEKDKDISLTKRRKQKVIDSKGARWIFENIKTKKTVKGDDGNESVLEVRTRAFGNIQFKGATRSSKAKFVQLSDDTTSETIFTLLTKVWKMEQPQLLISVTGGAKIFNMDLKLKQMFATGLRRVAQTPGTWVITGGTNTGVMKHVGEALQGVTKALIGIATWGIIANRKILRAHIADAPLGDTFPYQVASSMVKKGAFLDHNHTHFLLVHDGSQNKYGVEILLRSRLEKFIMESSGHVPSVLLVLEGGPNTLGTVHGACNGETPVPVVVIKGSGRAADLLSYAWAIEEELSEEKESAHQGLLKNIKECFPEMETEEKLWNIYLKVSACMQRKEFITIFQMSGEADVDEAILSAVLKTHQASPATQLKLTLLWNRADLAQNLILNKTANWKENDLEEAMIMALALDRVDFVKLLLNNCVSVQQLLSSTLLEFLYGYRSKTSSSSLRYEISDKEYTAIENDFRFYDCLKTLCGYESIDPLSSCLPFASIKRLVRSISASMVTRAKEDFCQLLDGNPSEFDNPYRELFIWAVLNNMHEMALFLWGLEEEGMAKAIIGAEFNSKLASLADERDLPEEIRKSFLENASSFKSVALGVLDACFASNEERTELLLTTELEQFPGHTCLSLASRSKFEEFIAHSSVQQLLNDVWTGALKTRDMSARAIFLTILCPLLLFKLDFRNKDEMKKLAKIESSNEESDDEDFVIESPRPISEAAEASSSDIRLIDANKTIQTYDSISSQKTDIENSGEKELPVYRKFFEFYFKIPMVKFYTNVLAYLAFLCLFTYVSMLKKESTTPGIAEIILIVFVVSLTLEEIHQIFQSESTSPVQLFKEHFSSVWNVFDVVAVVLFFVGLGLRLNEGYVQYGHLIYAIDAWVWILRLLHYFYAHRILGPYVLMIGKMFVDMCYFISILLVFLVAYGVLTKSILNPQPTSYLMLRDVFFHPYFNIYGELFIERDESPGVTRFGTPTINDYAEPITWFFLGFYLLIANVLLLNLLIAIFGNTFSEVQEKSDQIWKFERYDLIEEYARRPSLVPPFIILEHIYLVIRWFYFKVYRKCYLKEEENSGNLRTAVTEAEKEELAEFQMEIVAEFVRTKDDSNSSEQLETRLEEIESAIRTIKEKIEQ